MSDDYNNGFRAGRADALNEIAELKEIVDNHCSIAMQKNIEYEERVEKLREALEEITSRNKMTSSSVIARNALFWDDKMGGEE